MSILPRPLLQPLSLAAALSVLLAACSSPAPPVVVPPPPPVKAVVNLSPRIVEQAAAYRRYMTRTTAIAPTFADGAGVASALEIGAAYQPGQLARGAMAYAAVIALQDPAFVSGVRIYAKDTASRQQVVYELLKDPTYAVGLGGSASAAGRIVATLGDDAQRLYDGGKSVKQAAYDVQKQPWSKVDVADSTGRLARAKSLSSSVMTGDVEETARLQQASSAAAPTLDLASLARAPPYTTTVTRGLAIAALAVLGEATDANFDAIQALMLEPNVTSCMNMSKLNLYQCLAVARPHYEDVFCLGQHAMMDTARCVIRASGLPEPYEARFVPDASSIAKTMKPKKPPAKKRAAKR